MQVRLFFLTFSNASNSFFWFQLFAGTPPLETLLVHGWLIKTILSKDLWTLDKRIKFIGHCMLHVQGLYACYLMHWWTVLLLDSSVYGVQSCSSYKGLLSVDGFQLLLKGDTARDVLFNHVADVTPPTIFLKNRIGVILGHTKSKLERKKIEQAHFVMKIYVLTM